MHHRMRAGGGRACGREHYDRARAIVAQGVKRSLCDLNRLADLSLSWQVVLLGLFPHVGISSKVDMCTKFLRRTYPLQHTGVAGGGRACGREYCDRARAITQGVLSPSPTS